MIRTIIAGSPLRHLDCINRSSWFGRTPRASDTSIPSYEVTSRHTVLYSEDRILYRWHRLAAGEDSQSGSPSLHLKRCSDKKMALIAPAISAVVDPDHCAQELQAYFLDQGLEASIHLIEDEENQATAGTLYNAAIAELKDSCDYFVFQSLSLIPETADYRWAEALLGLAEYCRTAAGDCYQIGGDMGHSPYPAVLLAPKELLLAVDGFGEKPLVQALADLIARSNSLGYDSAQDIDGFFRLCESPADAFASSTFEPQDTPQPQKALRPAGIANAIKELFKAPQPHKDPEPAEFPGGLSILKVLEHRQETHNHYQHHRFRFATKA